MNTDCSAKNIFAGANWRKSFVLFLMLCLCSSAINAAELQKPKPLKQYGRFSQANVVNLVSDKNLVLTDEDMTNLVKLLESMNYRVKSQEVRQICNALIAGNHANAAVYTQLGRSYYAVMDEFGADDTAIKYLNKALSLDPNCSQAYCFLAEIANNGGDSRKALTYADRGIACPKIYCDCHLQKAYALVGLKRPHEALAALDLAEKYEPWRAEIQRTRGSLLEGLGRYDQAISTFRKAYVMDSKDWTAFQIAHCFEEKGCIDQAVLEVNKIVACNPRDADAYRMRSRLYEKLKKYQEALRDLTAAIDLEPTSKLFLDRARLYEAIGRKDLAAKDKKTAEAMIARPLD